MVIMIWVVRVPTKLARLGYSILWICEVWDVVAWVHTKLYLLSMSNFDIIVS